MANVIVHGQALEYNLLGDYKILPRNKRRRADMRP